MPGCPITIDKIYIVNIPFILTAHPFLKLYKDCEIRNFWQPRGRGLIKINDYTKAL